MVKTTLSPTANATLYATQRSWSRSSGSERRSRSMTDIAAAARTARPATKTSEPAVPELVPANPATPVGLKMDGIPSRMTACGSSTVSTRSAPVSATPAHATKRQRGDKRRPLGTRSRASAARPLG